MMSNINISDSDESDYCESSLVNNSYICISSSEEESFAIVKKSGKKIPIFETDDEAEEEGKNEIKEEYVSTFLITDLDSYLSHNASNNTTIPFEDNDVSDHLEINSSMGVELSKLILSHNASNNTTIPFEDNDVSDHLEKNFSTGMERSKLNFSSYSINNSLSTDLDSDFQNSNNSNDLIRENESASISKMENISTTTESEHSNVSDNNNLYEFTEVSSNISPYLSDHNLPSTNSPINDEKPQFRLPVNEENPETVIDLCNSDAEDIEKETLKSEKMRLNYEISEVTNSIENMRQILKTMNIDNLPDRGMKLQHALQNEIRNLRDLKNQLDRVDYKLNISKLSTKSVNNFGALPSANLNDMGKKALENHLNQQALTVDSLRHLHNSLNSYPLDEKIASDPDGLKVPLLDHQRRALAWLIWRENEKPSGGILADDMGLGKTLTMISLVLKKKQDSEGVSSDEDDYDDEETEEGNSLSKITKYKGGTLIICPSSLINQWESEVKKRVKRDLLSCEIHHGQKREKKARRLARPDLIVTSYAIARVEFQQESSPLFSVKWERIILDEAHVIRNHKSQTAVAVFNLKARYRWALTGTPIHNKTQDFFALVKFLRCKPFDDLVVWKKWVESRDETGLKRLNMLTKSLLLRRTKEVLIKEGRLESLPEKSFDIIKFALSKEELALYEQVANLSKTLLSQLLYQRAEKEELLNNGIQIMKNKNLPPTENPFSEHPGLNKLYQKVINKQNVETHVILVLLLRLRQICCHPSLIKSMIEKEAITQDGIESEDGTDVDLLEKMSNLAIDNDDNLEDDSLKKFIFNPNNPIFKTDWLSSKIKSILKLIEEDLMKTDDRMVIVSQWPSMLDIIHSFIKKLKGCKCAMLTGKVPVDQRMSIVSEFNNTSSSLKIMLLSLTAGGTGLNLIGANHLILVDLHWNPQLEAQACDRIYRMGQSKPVKIYKFVCTETIEERIQMLQTIKLELADGVLSGAKQLQTAKLSLNDLKMLFNMP